MQVITRFITIISLTSFALSTLSCKNKKTLSSSTKETQEEKAESIKSAYTTTNDFSDTQNEKEIAQDLLNRFGEALTAKNQKKIASIFSGQPLADLCIENLSTKTSSAEKEKITSQITKTLPLVFTQFATLLDFDEIEILKIEKISDHEFAAYTREWDDSMETYARSRWWFTLINKKWCLYDYEDIEGGTRMSTMLVVMLSSDIKGNTWIKPYQELTLMLQNLDSMNDIDFNLFVKNGKAIMDANPPEAVKISASIIYLGGLIQSEKFELASDTATTMLTEYPDQHILHYFLGTSQYGLGNYNNALASFKTYQQNMGTDSETLMLQSDVYYELGDHNEAKNYSLRGLAMNPRHAGCIASYAVLLKKEQWPELLPMIKNTKKDPEAYEIILDYAIACDKQDLAKWLLSNFKTNHPSETDLIEYYDSELLEDSQETD